MLPLDALTLVVEALLDERSTSHVRAVLGLEKMDEKNEAGWESKVRPNDCKDSLLLRLEHLTSDGTFRGVECASCGYGPMWTEGCSDLLSHHEQETSTGVYINNACPGCGLLVRETGELNRWSGKCTKKR